MADTNNHFGTFYWASPHFQVGTFFTLASSSVFGEEYRLRKLPRQVPIVDRAGRMELGFYVWMTDISDLQIITGNGSPEGIIEARKATLYMDETSTAGSILYIKRDRDVAGDRTKGWISIA